MFRRIFTAALGAGIGVGVLVAALQHVALVPMILEAEKYEKRAAPPHHQHSAVPSQSGVGVAALLVTEAKAHDHGDEAPIVAEDSPWRPVFTWIATTLTSVGFALLLVGAYAVSGRAIDAREGLLWGIAGFAAFALAPAFGLPPELPGSVAADLFVRQAWWIGTAVATAAAIGLMLFVRAFWAIPVGVALLVAPHVIGAPHPPTGAGLVPPELAAAFAARSLGVNAAFWALLGLATGALYARFGRSAKLDGVRLRTLVLGGARSGKSRYAEGLITALPPPWVYLATAEAGDEEMAARITTHRARRGADWRTLEAPCDLAAALAACEKMPVLIDCLTLWLSNLMLAEADIDAEVGRLENALAAAAAPVVMVANEVGSGIVPDHPLGRRFRDLQGSLNQRLAAGADRVVLMVAGLPLALKGALKGTP